MEHTFSKDITPARAWLKLTNRPIVIAGPCSAESKKQVLETAEALSKTTAVSIFRAGLWKPRSSPSSFQGLGEKALPWLNEAKKKTGLLTAVEVASPKHIELCLKNNIDVLWIGARTTVSPFSVEEITHALKGVDIPILIKNPVNPDINLWLGAIERFLKVGIHKLMAIHRGFNTYEKTFFRNHPLWEIPIELKRLMPELPIICDPSHIAGNVNYIEDIAQKALNLDFAGLMIETHPDPQNALSDASQQLSFNDFNRLLQNLKYPTALGNHHFEKKLESLRHEIDDIDIALLNLLYKRMKVVEKIGNYKKKHNITVLQIKRWSNIFAERLRLGKKLNLDEDFICDILKIVHKQSITTQHKIVSKK